MKDQLLRAMKVLVLTGAVCLPVSSYTADDANKASQPPSSVDKQTRIILKGAKPEKAVSAGTLFGKGKMPAGYSTEAQCQKSGEDCTVIDYCCGKPRKKDSDPCTATCTKTICTPIWQCCVKGEPC